ncbi:flagellar hook-length control protein FliK [Pseudoflavonifractor sp. 524-17]|uniref:flagellar hook-length control protein FliK n=1 Tax=Pseudoflavonifractor sp. 524-17 TaxID=2304577 RepID=UPI00137AB72B|nr:flagellar hook-length control protein FliK [Pseudoflavonifractor sp. 524-17]NCE66044.1 flagellar hook-length control protein FliK [Pseudoflavonifractor sp. 524-17]
MEQVSNGMLAMMQMLTEQQAANMGKSSPPEGEFQKLLEEKTQETATEFPAKKEEPKPADQTQEQPAAENQAPAKPQPAEDPKETVRRLIECGLVQPEQVAQFVAVTQGAQPENGDAAPIEGAVIVTPGATAVVEEVQPQQMEMPAAGTELPVEDVVQAPAAEDGFEAVLAGENTAQDVEHTPETELTQTAAAEDTQPKEAAAKEVQPEAIAQKQDGGEEVQVVDASPDQRVFHDVQEVPVKVGEAPAAEQSEEPQDINTQLADKLVQALERGDSKVEIQLTPDSLGSVKVELTRLADGALHVVLTAERGETRSLLERHAANLQNILAHNEEHVQVEVPRQEESQRQDLRDGHNGNQQNQQQEQRRQQPQNSEDFLQQLRLGLIPMDGDRF